MLWAVCCVCFFGFFWLGELVVPTGSEYNPAIHLSAADIAVDSPSNPCLIALHLKRAKMDQLGKGAYIYIRRSDNDLCPVAALLAYLALRNTDPGPLFRTAEGTPLRKSSIVGRVREALSLLGYDQSSYASHSFRIGAATTAAAAGMEDSTIQALWRWSSPAFISYIKLSQQQLANLAAQLASAVADS